jgi:hypothetical protein
MLAAGPWTRRRSIRCAPSSSTGLDQCAEWLVELVSEAVAWSQAADLDLEVGGGPTRDEEFEDGCLSPAIQGRRFSDLANPFAHIIEIFELGFGLEGMIETGEVLLIAPMALPLPTLPG